MASIEVDQAQLPILHVRYLARASDEEFQAYLDQLQQILDRAKLLMTKAAILFDATAMVGGGPTAIQRKRQAEWMVANEDACRLHNVGYAFVIPSTVVRGVLTAILWLRPLPCPHVVVATVEEAQEWCQDRLAEAGEARLAAPPA